jgi:hypothetical protein
MSTAVLMVAMLSGVTVAAQSAPLRKTSQLWNFDEQGLTCRAKGRLQDRDYCASHMMDQIVTDGKSAIPILISQLRETRPSPKPVYDWTQTTSGDIAYFILTDLFTDSDCKTFAMPGLEALREPCDSYAEDCWDRFLKKHGRSFVQNQWLSAWNKNKDRIYWDDTARCFRVSSVAKPK